MQYRTNPRNGQQLSVLGFGCMRFTRRGSGIDQEKADREMLLALEKGVNYFDTAYIYPGSEAAVGEIFERNRIRDKVNIATKLPQYLIGNRAALETWYEKRALYIERGKVLRHLTRSPEKIESIKDYISMPALPFYLFGAENILEVNSVDETDSYRKCKKAHQKAVRMGCLLFPELLSGDGVHTLYCAPPQWKEYGNYSGGPFKAGRETT